MNKTIQAYVDNHERCALCGILSIHAFCLGARQNRLQVAHILGGPNRKHVAENLLMLCQRCHGLEHGATSWYDRYGTKYPEVTRRLLIALKAEQGELEPEKLASIWGRTPEYVRECAGTQIPSYFLQERRRRA